MNNINTADEAIADSIAYDHITHVCLPMEEADKLGLAADDCVEIKTEPARTEYWGTTDDGQNWRVTDYAEK